MSDKYTKKYTKTWWIGSWRHQWQVVGRFGGVHFHVTEYLEGTCKDLAPSGGVETHWRTPPDYMADQAPHYTDCPVIGGLCWHDGTSLGAEPFINAWQRGDEDYIWRELQQWADGAFEAKEATP